MGVRGKKSSSKKLEDEGRASTGKLQTEKMNSEPFDLSASSPKQQQQQPVYPVDLGTEEDDPQEESKGQLPPATSGSLELHIVEADLDRNLDSFGNQDPFAIFELDGQKFQTKTIDGGGKKPTWNE